MKKLTETQAKSLYETLKASIDPKDTLLQVCLETGCRVSESLILTPMSLEAGSLRISPLKHSKERVVSISKNLESKLKALSNQKPKRFSDLATETRVLASKRRALCRRFQQHTKALFGQTLNIHRLRHTAFLRLYAETKDLLLVKDWAGHVSTKSTLVYLEEDRRDQGNAIMQKVLARG